jgi:hypothetical protein
MCASPLSLFRSGPPPPRVALLSDAVFFTRVIPVAPNATASEVAAQVELALEAISPFPIAQLYHGHFWKPGLDRAFVFASYRRRFTSEQTAAWPQAELVLPAFAALFGAQVAPATTIILEGERGFTAVHWENPTMPSRVLFRAVAEEATPEERAAAREELVRSVGGSKAVIDLAEPPLAEASANDDEIVFRAGTLVSRLPVTLSAALDVRDKDELAALRRTQTRDLWFWRTAMGAAAVMAFLAVGELFLLGGKTLWQNPRLAKIKTQAPLVEKIDNAQKLAARIEELTTQRLLPFEMMEIVRKKPDGIQWARVTTKGRYTLIIDAKSNNSSDNGAYAASLRALPECESVEATSPQLMANGTSTFTLTIKFRPGAVKPEVPAT